MQHNGSMLFLGGGALSWRVGASQIGGFLELDVGAMWLARQQVFAVFRVATGLRFPLVQLGAEHRKMFLKVGLFLEGVADHVNAEPAGVDAALSISL